MTSSTTAPRMVLPEAAPEPYQALVALTGLAGRPLDAGLREMVSLRVSLLNGCTYCIALHRGGALHAGVPEAKLDALRDAPGPSVFTAPEQAALRLAEHITTVSATGVPDPVYADAARHFTPAELAALMWTASLTNTWNRLARATGTTA